MSGSYSYPGIYIQELPSSSHAIVPGSVGLGLVALTGIVTPR